MKGLFIRDIRLAFASGNHLLIRFLFFLAIILIMPFGIGPSAQLLSGIGSGIIWIAALLSILLDLDHFFQADREDGSLDIMIMEADFISLALSVFVKCLAYWVGTVLPLIIITPFLSPLLSITSPVIWTTVLALLVGTPAITLIGSAASALTVTLRRSGVILFVIVLPLTIPVLVFGVSASSFGADETLFPLTPLLFLIALTLFFSVLGPVAAAAALKCMSE